MIPLAMFLFLIGGVLSLVGGTVFAHGWVSLRVGPKGIGASELREFGLAWILAVASGLTATGIVIGAAYMRGIDLGRMIG